MDVITIVRWGYKPTNITIVSWFMDVYGSYTVTIVRRGYKPT